MIVLTFRGAQKRAPLIASLGNFTGILQECNVNYATGVPSSTMRGKRYRFRIAFSWYGTSGPGTGFAPSEGLCCVALKNSLYVLQMQGTKAGLMHTLCRELFVRARP